MYHTEAMNTIATRNSKPLPKSKRNRGTRAATEVTTHMLTQGCRMTSQTLDRPMAMPIGIPARQASRNPTHICRRDTDSSASIVPSWSRRRYSLPTTEGAARKFSPATRPTPSQMRRTRRIAKPCRTNREDRVMTPSAPDVPWEQARLERLQALLRQEPEHRKYGEDGEQSGAVEAV